MTSPFPATVRIRRSFTERKQRTIEQVDRLAGEREQWIARHRFYYDEDWLYLRFLVPEGKRVLDLGCGAGELLNILRPANGIGVDISQTVIDRARARYPNLTFTCGDVENLEEISELDGVFDVIVMSDTIGSLDDCLETLRNLHHYCKPHTRVIVTYHSTFWEPLFAGYAWLTRRGLRSHPTGCRARTSQTCCISQTSK